MVKAALPQRAPSLTLRRGVSTLLLTLAVLVAGLELRLGATEKTELGFITGHAALVGLALLRTWLLLVQTRALVEDPDVRMRDIIARHRLDVSVALGALLLLVPAPRVAGTLVILRMAARAVMELSETPRGARLLAMTRENPLRALVLSFAVLIVVGTMMLLAPAATVDGLGAPFDVALFTATSAVCVTGLVVVDTGTAFTLWGQGVILVLIQLGALGVMVLAAGFAVLVGGEIPFSRSARDLEVLHDTAHARGLRNLVVAVAAGTFVTELVGTGALYLLWAIDVMPLPAAYDDAGSALYWSAFHAVSAFANAGFALQPDSLEPFATIPAVSLVFGVLIVIGGLGFVVLSDLARALGARERHERLFDRLSLQTRIVLIMSAILIALGAVTFLFFEYDGALAELSTADKIVAALFQSVSFRTAGFNTVPFAGLAPSTIVVGIVLMFVGASPGGTGGGVKTTTMVVVGASIRAMFKSRDDVEVFQRTIPRATVYRATAIVFSGGVLIATALAALAYFEAAPFEALAFEVVSAVGTVGLSLGITPSLSPVGRFIVVGLMFAGRIGPLSLALAVGARAKKASFRYAEARVAVG